MLPRFCSLLSWIVFSLFWSHGACHFSLMRSDTAATSTRAYVGPPSLHLFRFAPGEVDWRRGGVVVHATSSHISRGSTERSCSCWARNFRSRHGAGRSCLRGGGHGSGCDGLVALRGAQENKSESSSSRAEEAEAAAERGSESGAPRALSEDERKAAMEYISQEMLALHTAEDGSIDYKALSKLVPLRADKGELQVLLEDDNLIAVSKPQGMAMNPPHRFLRGTLINLMLGYLGGERPPYVLHRLDMWTSGVVVFSKNKKLVPLIHKLFRDREVQKDYVCLVDGLPSEEQIHAATFLVDAPIDKDESKKIMRRVGESGQRSQTKFVVLALSRQHNVTLLRAMPLTGRTHQIRVHAQYAGLPIVGDNVYGRESSLYVNEEDMLRSDQKCFAGDTVRTPLKLHARRLRFKRPDSGLELDVSAPLPQHFSKALESFGIPWDEEAFE